MRAVRRKRKRGVVPPVIEHVVTVYPGAIAATPAPDAGWTNTANILADDGAVAVVDPFGNDQPATHFQTFLLQEILPGNAVISTVEVEVENRHDGTAGAAARPQINPAVNGEPGTWVGRTDMTNVLTPFSNDITGQAATNQVAWSTPTDYWTREMLLDGNFKLGVRSRNLAGVPGIHEWDYVRLKITYTGAPPETPAQIRHTVNIGTSGDGDGTVLWPAGDTSEGDTSVEVPQGSILPLTPVADPLSLFDEWEGSVEAGDEQDIPLQLLVDEEKSIDARFIGTPPGDPVESHWGDIIAEDLGDGHPIDHWLETSTPWYSGQVPAHSGNPRSDPYVERIAETGAWIPHRQSSPTTHFRRFTIPPAHPQSIYDRYMTPTEAWDVNPNAASSRCQAQRWSSTAAFWIGREGDRVFITWGWRVRADHPLTKPATGAGATGYTQLVQWKVRASGYSEVDAVNVGSDGVQFEFSSHPGNVETRDVCKCPHGVWHRGAVEMLLSPDPDIGYITNWVKLNGDSGWTQVGPKRFKGTLVNNGYRAMGIGPYHKIIATTNNQEHHQDYRDVQVIEYI